jgi:hypothetical protein
MRSIGEVQIRVFLYFGEDRRLLMSITQRGGDYYASLGFVRPPAGLPEVHLSYHRSGRRKFTPDAPRSVAPIFMDEPTHDIKGANDLCTFVGPIWPGGQWKQYAPKPPHTRAVGINAHEYGRYLQLIVHLIEPQDPPALPRYTTPFQPHSELLIQETSPWLYLYWERVPDEVIMASTDFGPGSMWLTMNAVFAHARIQSADWSS